MLVRGVHDLVGDPSGASGPDQSTGVHACSIELVNCVADCRGDFAWLVNVPGEAADVIALAHRQDEHLAL
jgi:hypothetical protein